MTYKLHYFSGTLKFRYFEIEKFSKKSTRLVANNTILFVLEGELGISCNEFPLQVETKNDLLFLPQRSIIHVTIKKNTKL